MDKPSGNKIFRSSIQSNKSKNSQGSNKSNRSRSYSVANDPMKEIDDYLLGNP